MATNTYSALWFELFLPLQEEWTQHEVAFLTRQLPLPRYRRILDLACGPGRHALELARHTYQVTGLDRDEAAITEARRRAREAGQDITYVVGEVRHLGELSGAFDAVISMWQSLCYFEEATNVALLHSIAEILTPGGRFVVDLYNRDYFEQHQGETEQQIAGVTVTSQGYLQGDRWHSVLSYQSLEQGDLGGDHMEWQIFTPDEFSLLARTCGLIPVLACTWGNEQLAPSPSVGRMQIVLEKPGES